MREANFAWGLISLTVWPLGCILKASNIPLSKCRPDVSKKRRSHKKLSRPEAHSPQSEPQAIESLTVFWGLCIFATLVLVVVFLLLRGSVIIFQTAEGNSNTLTGFADLLLFSAIVTGSVGGVLTPIVQSQRKRRAPKSLQMAAVVIAVVPWVLLAILVARS